MEAEAKTIRRVGRRIAGAIRVEALPHHGEAPGDHCTQAKRAVSLLTTSGKAFYENGVDRQGKCHDNRVMKALYNPPVVDRTPALDSGPDKTIEEKLIDLLKDGLCDLYTAVAVLETTGRIAVNAPHEIEHLYVVR